MDYSVRLGIATATEQLQKERDAALERLKRLDAYDEPNEQVQGFVLDVLEQLENRGIDTTNWDGDESSATILASCVAGKIHESQEERDAAQKAAGEMRKQIDCAAMALEFWYKMPNPTPAQIDVAREALRAAMSTDCGHGYHHESKCKIKDDQDDRQ